MAKPYNRGRAPLTREDLKRKRERRLRAAGFSSSSSWKNKYQQTADYWARPEKVRDPKTAFRYLMANVMSSNGGKLLSSFASRGEYYWVERDRSADQSYYIVRKRGNYVVVTQRQWVVDGQGVNTFMGSLVGFKEEPKMVERVILRHPIMDVQGFRAAYAAAAPQLGFFDD